jgi:3-hydroxyisobutyrate dehydrogenase
MGTGMAERLLAAKFPLTIYNRSAEKMKRLAEAGAYAAGSPREAAGRAEIVLSIVADDVASRGIWLGEQGALAGARAGTVLVESSTLTVPWVRELAAAAAARGCELLDAPVTGSRPQAASGELLFLVGGAEKAFKSLKPVLGVLGRDALYLGPTGSGSVMKLINNFMAGVQVASLAEAVGFIEASGLDREKALSVLVNGAPGSPIVKTIASRFVAGDFTPNFLLRLLAKDMHYVFEEGTRHHLTLQTAAAAAAVVHQAMAMGRGEEDMSAVVEFARARAAAAVKTQGE